MKILKEFRDDCQVLTFNHQKPTNPFSIEMMTDLIVALKEAESCEKTNSIVLYGGDNRSFSAGGDFSQVLKLGTFEDISAMLHIIIDLYAEILKVTKPIVSAIDNYAIGMGFQIALLTDYRIATPQSQFLMPELKNGIACTLGGVLLEYMVGRKLMMDICYNCEKLTIEQCEKWGIVNEIAKDGLIQEAIERAGYYGSFPNDAFRNTKYVNNLRFIDHLESVRELTIEAHFKTLSNKKHVKYMESVIGKSDQ
ncbi:MAG: enoyl-CoA hydratase/isomerase family protein [Bacteroidetes bacterium]|nr:enoyl-CoA hydratase/isomerase family protein [Bacteroidota bacterium]